jgi:beta-galactosidase/beta-glucuronidase
MFSTTPTGMEFSWFQKSRWQFTEEQMRNPKVIALAQQMFREMIEEDENHPSIFAWSVCNESQATTQGGRA